MIVTLNRSQYHAIRRRSFVDRLLDACEVVYVGCCVVSILATGIVFAVGGGAV